MSKPKPRDNPWDPRAWSSFSVKQVSREGSATVDESVRAPNDEEIRVLSAEIPEAAGQCLFVIEREADAASGVPVLNPDSSNAEARVALVNSGLARVSLSSPDLYRVSERVAPKFTLLLTSTTRLHARSPYWWKKTRLWESRLSGGLTVLHPAEALEVTKAFGSLSCGFFPDPGYRADFAPGRLTFLGPPESRPPLTYPAFRGDIELLTGFAPLRVETVGEYREPYDVLSAGCPDLVASGAYWLTGIDQDMTNHGFVLSRALGEIQLNAQRSAQRFLEPPWVSVADPASVPDDRPLVALFSAPAEAEHVALRSLWAFAGETLFESRIDYALPGKLGFRIVHPLGQLAGPAVGTLTGLYTLA